MYANAKAVNIQHQRFWLLPKKAIFWQKRKTVLVADLHIGKSGHFRKHGIPVPRDVNLSNLQSLSKVLKKTSAEHLVILGDLFHSNINKEWQEFITWRKNYRELEVSLVIGNHDILKKQNYHSGMINLFKKMTMGPFLMVHDLDQYNKETDKYVLSGHIHPAVKLKGRGRQSMKLPCFYFNSKHGILPAYGQFTGTYVIEPKDKDRVFIVVNNKVLTA